MNILVPVDFTEYSFNAVEVASRIAKQNNAELTLLHIIDVGNTNYVWLEDSDTLSMNVVVERYLYLLNNIKNDIKKKYELNVKILLERGQVINVILTTASNLQVDLIIIGTHGTEPKNFFLGFNAFHIIKQAPCSVLTIPKERVNGTITKIIFPFGIHNINEKCKLLEKLVQPDDIVVEIPILNAEDSINMNVLNETIAYLEKKFAEEHVKSIGELKNFVDVVSDTLHDLNIELITVRSREDSGQIPVLSIIHRM